MMKVFEFLYDVEYGGGVMLIGAHNLDEAMLIASTATRGFGHWVFNFEHSELIYTGHDPNILLQESWVDEQE